MGEKENRIKIAQIHLRRSKALLNVADLLFKNNYFEDSVSRAYYSMFHAAYALLYLLGEQPRTHRGLINLFWIKVIDQELLAKDYGKALHKIFSYREEADYGAITFISEKEAQEALDIAKDFNNKISDLLYKKFNIKPI